MSVTARQAFSITEICSDHRAVFFRPASVHWDFFHHYVELTELSLKLRLAGC
jgi:hypothetical protein